MVPKAVTLAPLNQLLALLDQLLALRPPSHNSTFKLLMPHLLSNHSYINLKPILLLEDVSS